MHDHHELIENRLKRVLEERIIPAIHTPIAELTLKAWHVEGGQGEPVDPPVALGLGHDRPDYQDFAVGQPWGPAWGTSWIHLTGTVPPVDASTAITNDAGNSSSASGSPDAGSPDTGSSQSPSGDNPSIDPVVELVVDLGFSQSWPGFQAEGLVYRPDGTTIKALNPLNTWIPVEPGTTEIDLYVEAAANPFVFTDNPFLPTRLGEKSTAGDSPRYTMSRADINIFNSQVWELVQDFQVLSQLAAELDLGSPRRWEILYAIERALDVVRLSDIVGSASQARQQLEAVLAKPANASAHTLSAIGHAHIDSAWLWPVRETIRKVARTTSNVVNLLESDPDLKYAMSSAQQYEWLKERRPNVFEKVKKAVADGRFIPVGGMWVESDTNMVGSEAMARQFVYGQRFFQENFGLRCQEVWLPDSFGYSASLPQIVTQAGAKWFLTQKISWNNVNKFPHHTFNWEGLDGTRVFTHFPPVDTYNAELSGKEIAHAVNNFRDKGAASTSLVPFGWGDGGGGPTREMLARARRTKDLEGSAKVTIATPQEFFEKAQAEYPNAPVWKGELYLELHRGTYTSQAATKAGNRRSEHLLREAEIWSATAAARGLIDYPYEELDRLWKLVLLNQFHDILPGSAIAWVHREAAEQYAVIACELDQIISDALQALAPALDIEWTPEIDAAHRLNPSQGITFFNSSPYPRAGIAPFSAGAMTPAETPIKASQNGEDLVVNNGLIRVRFGADAVITSIIDIEADRELVPAGQGANLLQLHADFPNMWDAWDIDEFYKNTVTDIRELDSLEVAEQSDLVSVTIKRSFRGSQITQRVHIAAGSKTIKVHSDVDWHEKETLLKVAFPIDVHTDHASYETQYGHIQRPTHENTSWDSARFEVCAHRWVHVGEPGFGAAAVNNSKYGHDVSRHQSPTGSSFSTVRISLLRGPQFPDPETDQGQHSFSYGLAVGAEIADAVAAGYAINLPWQGTPAGGVEVEPLVSTDSPAALIEAIKLADDRSGDVIVRLYEPLGARARVTLHANFPVKAVEENNLLEEPFIAGSLSSSDLADSHGSVVLNLRPFQILTLRFSKGN